MTFPSVLEFLRYYNVFLITGPTILVVGVIWAFRLTRRRRKTPDQRPSRSLMVAALGTCLIGGVHLVGIYASVVNAARFRMQARDVSAVRVVRIDENGSRVETKSFVVDDRAELAEGLSLLKSATARPPVHEHFVNGYSFQLRLGEAGAFSNFYLSMYRMNNAGATVSVVIPHIGVEADGSMSNAGIYASPEFASWAEQFVRSHGFDQ